jgi:TPR repeat protein
VVGHANALYCSVIAAHELGVHFELGVGCDINAAESSKWYHRAAKASSADKDIFGFLTLVLGQKHVRAVPTWADEARIYV